MLFEVEAAGLDLREIEDVVDDLQERRGRIAHGAECIALVGAERRALQHVDHAQHAVHRRADLVAHRGKEGRLGLVGVLRLALGEQGRVARQPLLVVGDLQALRQLLLLVGQSDVVVLPAMDVAHIGHQMADIGAAGDADQLVERIDRRQQHEKQRRRGRHREGVEGRRMRRADRHRRGDGGEQHQAEQHALQLVILGGERIARDAPARARQGREGGEIPAPADHFVVDGLGPGEIAPQDVEAEGDGDIDGERRPGVPPGRAGANRWRRSPATGRRRNSATAGCRRTGGGSARRGRRPPAARGSPPPKRRWPDQRRDMALQPADAERSG